MALMVSPAGEMEVKLLRIGGDQGQLVVEGQIGVWDSKIYFSAPEVMQLMKLSFNRTLFAFIFGVPFTLIKKSFHRDTKSS